MVFFTGVVDICLYGTIRSSSKLASWNERYPTPCRHVACVERGWHRIFVLGSQLLWEGNCSQCRGDCIACLCYLLKRMGLVELVILHWYFDYFLTIKIILLTQIKFRHGLPPGDGVLYYPGEVFSTSHQPVASLRLERILNGLQVEHLSSHNFASYSQHICILNKCQRFSLVVLFTWFSLLCFLLEDLYIHVICWHKLQVVLLCILILDLVFRAFI